MLDVFLIACISCQKQSQVELQPKYFLISQTVATDLQVLPKTINTDLQNNIPQVAKNGASQLLGTEKADIKFPGSWHNFLKSNTVDSSKIEVKSEIKANFVNNSNQNSEASNREFTKIINRTVAQVPESEVWDSFGTLKNDSYYFSKLSESSEINSASDNQQQIQVNTSLIDNYNRNPELPYRDPTQLKDPIPQIPENIPKLPTENEDKNSFKALMETTIDLNAQKYPFIVNTSDNLIIKPLEYRPAKSDIYTNLNLAVTQGSPNNKELGDNFSGIIKSSLSVYPQDSQFFWTLDNNTVVIETKGFHTSSSYQGRSVISNYEQIAKSSLRLWGVQTAWAFPPQIFDLVGQENLRFTSVALETTGASSSSFSSSDFLFNSTWVPNSSLILFDNPDYGTTYSPAGGGSLFENLEADNAPIFLQGFSTVNLQGLLANGEKLQAGTIIPQENLKKIGLVWGDFFTGAGYSFDPINTSQAGIKSERYPQLAPLRDATVANKDILTILSNPYLTTEEKNWHYLNSLWWVGFAPGQASVSTTKTSEDVEDWNRMTMNFSHNRTQLHYDIQDAEMTYNNIFTNPGLSLTYTNFDHIDTNQTMTASIGLVLGSVFQLIDQNNLNHNLQVAHKKFEDLQPLSNLKTKATPQQRSEMNSRLNNTLSDVDQNTSLHQVSGSWTFAGNVTPKKSQLWQFKTGLSQRGVQFFEQKVSDWSAESPTFFGYVRPPDFGPLTYQGYNVPVNATQISPESDNHTFNVYNIITNGQGISYVKQFNYSNRPVMTTVPFPGVRRPADMDFGLIEMTKYRTRSIKNSLYSGYIYLPSLEFSLAGSSDNFNYTFSAGSWFNPDSNSAPTVNQNNSQISGGLQEPSIGFYASGDLKWNFENLKVAKDKKYYELTRHIPFIKGNWNSDSNRLNVVSVNSGYTFSWQNPRVGLASSLFFTYTPEGMNATIPKNSQGELVMTNIGRFQINDLMRFNYTLEVNGQTFINSNLTFPVINSQFGQLSIGAYYRNYITTLQGLSSRIEANAYGGTLEYLEPTTNSFVNLNLGTNGQGLETLVNVGLRWKF